MSCLEVQGHREECELSADHLPVLCSEVLELLAVPTGGSVVDATVGLGGHSGLLLERIGPEGLLIGLDADEVNLELARGRLGPSKQVRLFHASFQEVESVLTQIGLETVDGILADLGISSNQLEDPSRGFSFKFDGPLDMRIDRRRDETAADMVNRLPEKELADIFYGNAQERSSRRIAKAIHRARRTKRITTTAQLADIVCEALGQQADHRRARIHPATRTFMALRIAVNREFDALKEFVQLLPRILRPGARAAVISFHSLEDVICKNAFREMKQAGLMKLVTRRPVTPSADERRRNPRSRSAKLRVVERTSTD